MHQICFNHSHFILSRLLRSNFHLLFSERTYLPVCWQYSFDAMLTVIVLFLNLYCQKTTTRAFLCTFDLLIWVSEAQWQSYYFFGIEFFIKNGQCTPHVVLGRSLIRILQSENLIPILVENSHITRSCLMMRAPQGQLHSISLPYFDRHSCSLSVSRNSSASASITFLMFDVPTCTCIHCFCCLTQIGDHRHLPFSSLQEEGVLGEPPASPCPPARGHGDQVGGQEKLPKP